MSLPSPAPRDTRKLAMAVGLVGVLAAYPPTYLAWHAGLRGMLNALAGDTHLYMSIARYSLDKPFFTFDRVHPTNGFHPFWQYLLEKAFHFASSRAGQVALTYGLSTLLVTLGAMLTAAAIFRFTRSFLLSILVVPGVYYALIGAQFHSQSLWSFADGMESGLSLFWGGLFFYVLSSGLCAAETLTPRELLRSPRLFMRLGLVLPPLVLTRLDDVFLVFALALVILALSGELRDKLRAVAWIGLPTGIALAAYLTYNKLTVGAGMPLSGATKSGIALPAGLLMALSTLWPPTMDLKNALSSKPSDGAAFYSNEFRALMMLVPVAVALVYASLVFRSRKKQVAYLLPLGVALHLVIKGMYNLINVNPWHQGTWYYAFNILAINVLVAWLLRDAVRVLETQRTTSTIVTGTWVVYALITGGQHYQARAFGSDMDYHAYQARQRVDAALHKAGVTGLVNFDDGITAFMFDVPAMHGWAFATDREAFEAYKRGEFIKLAYERGYGVLTSHEWFPITHRLLSSDEIREHFRSGPFPAPIRGELDNYDFETVYEDLPLQMGFYRLLPRGSARTFLAPTAKP